MVLTRGCRDEIKWSVTSSIASVLEQDDFLKQIIQKVSEAVAKTLQEKFDQWHENVKELISNSPVIGDPKCEVGTLKTENDYMLKKLNELDQDRRSNNLIIFKIMESEQQDLAKEVMKVCDRHLGFKLSDRDILTCYTIEKKD
nr:unnamed protein product [Callosobruchus analis]